MNRYFYFCGNPFKVKYREHFCMFCNHALSVIKHRKVVDPRSEEAKYYDFHLGGKGKTIVFSPCEFTHSLFCCPNCGRTTEYVTQTGFEDIDVLIKKIKKRYECHRVETELYFQTDEDELIQRLSDLQGIRCAVLKIEVDQKSAECRIDCVRMEKWERPYCFRVKKRKLLKSIGRQIKSRNR